MQSEWRKRYTKKEMATIPQRPLYNGGEFPTSCYITTIFRKMWSLSLSLASDDVRDKRIIFCFSGLFSSPTVHTTSHEEIRILNWKNYVEPSWGPLGSSGRALDRVFLNITNDPWKKKKKMVLNGENYLGPFSNLLGNSGFEIQFIHVIVRYIEFLFEPDLA